jgi:thymidylate synthase
MMHIRTNDIREFFKTALLRKDFVTDRTGCKTIEMLGASFLADRPTIFGEVNDEYIFRELRWYDSHSTNINDIYGGDRPAPKAWELSANKYGEINSNYGLLLHGEQYYDQYNNVLDCLLGDSNTRRATAIYTRPSIWVEAVENGKNDFICTNAVTYYVRDNKLHCVVQMRSNDVVFGYKNDYAWQEEVLIRLTDDYNSYSELDHVEVGNIYWQVQSLHVYERHFDLVV